jgi:hypothetical protein
MTNGLNAGEQHKKIQEFVLELSGFATVAEETLNAIESKLEENKGLFSVFSERMIAIRGTAQQLNLPDVAAIARLAEEISVKGVSAPTRPQVRKCVGSLWDALTTIKYMLIHYREETTEEQRILMNRLQSTLKALGGERPTISDDEIAALLKNRNN